MNLRKCRIKDYAANKVIDGLFHRWSQEYEIVAPSVMVGGHSGGVVGGVFAVVELPDGTCTLIRPEAITFINDEAATDRTL